MRILSGRIGAALVAAGLLATGAAAWADGGLWVVELGAGHSADQRAILVHDAAAGLETMVLSTRYVGQASDFAWVIPVPELPARDQVAPLPGGDAAFEELAWATAPKATRSSQVGLAGCGGCGMAGGGSSGAGDQAVSLPGVNVVDRLSVSGLDISLLRATRAADLTGWLNDNGYHFAPEGLPVIQGYVADGWKFVAVKVDTTGTAAAPQTGYFPSDPLRITFRTDRLVFPMRISAVSTAAEGVQVLLYVFAGHRVRAGSFPTVRMVAPSLSSTQPDPSAAYEAAFRARLEQPEGRAFVVEYAAADSVPPGALLELPGIADARCLTRLRTYLRPQDMTRDVDLVADTTDDPFGIYVTTRQHGTASGPLLLIGAVCLRLRLRRRVSRRRAVHEALLLGALGCLAFVAA